MGHSIYKKRKKTMRKKLKKSHQFIILLWLIYRFCYLCYHVCCFNFSAFIIWRVVSLSFSLISRKYASPILAAFPLFIWFFTVFKHELYFQIHACWRPWTFRHSLHTLHWNCEYYFFVLYHLPFPSSSANDRV